MNRNELLKEALVDAEGQNARVELCKQLNAALLNWGSKLSLAGNFVGGGPTRSGGALRDELKRTLGLACVVQIAGELGAASADLFEGRRYYAAWALLRQLVECEYLCWAFSEQHELARKWLDSSSAERRSSWQPRKMRERSEGKFRAKDYGVHCEIGGHPTPRGCTLIGPSRSIQPSMDWLDLAAHLSSIWNYTIAATPEVFAPLMDRKPGPSGPSSAVSIAVQQWRLTDPLLLLVSTLPDFPDLD
jgi:hypothetical protein